MTNIRDQLKKDLQFTMERMAYYYDKSRSENPPFKEGNKVYLLGKNIRTKRPSKKLDYQKLGPYPITRKLSEVTYELKLPPDLKIHPIFHVSLLEPVPKDLRENAYEMEFENDDPTLHKVDKLLNYKKQNNKKYYLVKWTGTDDKGKPWEDTWEPAKNITPDLIQQYHQERKSHPD